MWSRRLLLLVVLVEAAVSSAKSAPAATPGRAPAAAAQAKSADAPPMVHVPGGTFSMGTDQGHPHEGPAHRVTVKPFWLDRHEVTNAEFSAFVSATHHVTESERLGWSSVWSVSAGAWTAVRGADWRHPEGPTSSITGRGSRPVVHVSWADAASYARWAGKRLPTEAEWEWAARGGLEAPTYPWGSELTPGGRHMANTWQGPFPARDEARDGFARLAPVGSFPPNGYGLHDMAGNVWEWTADWFAPEYYRTTNGAVDPQGPSSGTERVIRGGSWLCSPSYCVGYRVSARQKTPPDSGLNHLGFRCAR